MKTKNVNGVVYTPKILSDYLALKMKKYYTAKTEEISVFDPACGESALLLSIKDKFHKSKFSFIGCDIDSEAINISSKNLKNYDTDFLTLNTLNPSLDRNYFSFWDDYQKLNGYFDMIIANPPWGANLSNKIGKHNHYSLLKGQYDSYDLFFELCLNISREDCLIGFILPDSFFSIEHTPLREKLTNDTEIKFIARLGESIFPTINRGTLLIIVKKKKAKNNKIDVYNLNYRLRKQILSNEISFSTAEKLLIHKIPQKRFKQYDNYYFDIDSIDNKCFVTTNKISNSSGKISDFLVSSRGVEISKKGIVCQCSICSKWFPEPHRDLYTCPHCKSDLNILILKKEIIIFNDPISKEPVFVSGENLRRYRTIGYKHITIGLEGIKYKELELYQGKKILIRKTGVGITATLDYTDKYTNQVVYILKPKENVTIPLEFFLGIINSRALFFYLIKTFGENDWRTHPYLTQKQILNFPVPNIENKDILISEVTNIVRQLTIQNTVSAKLDSRLEYLIASLYGLDKKDYYEIFKVIKSAQQLIPIRDLNYITENEIFGD